MWCPQCRQDVPGIASGAVGKLCCVRCRTPVTRTGAPASNTAEPPAPAAASPGLPNEVDLTAQFEALERLTAWDFGDEFGAQDWPPVDVEGKSDAAFARFGLVDPPHTLLRGWHRSGANAPSAGLSLLSVGRKPLAGWALLSCGLASFFCGAALLTWSLFGNRPELWTMGVPITLAGQVGLLLGVVLALDRLGHQNRQTVDRLGKLDERLNEIRAAAWLSAPASQTTSADRSREMFS